MLFLVLFISRSLLISSEPFSKYLFPYKFSMVLILKTSVKSSLYLRYIWFIVHTTPLSPSVNYRWGQNLTTLISPWTLHSPLIRGVHYTLFDYFFGLKLIIHIRCSSRLIKCSYVTVLIEVQILLLGPASCV